MYSTFLSEDSLQWRSIFSSHRVFSSTGLLVDAAGQKAPVNNQSMPGNIRRGIGAEIDRSSHQFFGSAEAADRRSHQQFLTAQSAIEQICIQGGAEDSRRDGVYRYTLL